MNSNKKQPKTWQGVLGCLIFAFIPAFYFVYAPVRLFVGQEKIGSLFEKREYQTQYWVFVQPENESTKNYRLIGDIERTVDDSDEPERFSYDVMKIYWPNGGFSEFDGDCYFDKKDFKTNESFSCRDKAGRYYSIHIANKVEQ